MTRIGLATALFDIAGDMWLDILPANSQTDYVSRRVSRTATLDGLSSIVDNGFTASDATFNIKWMPETRAEHEQLLTLVKNHSSINITTQYGYFNGVIDNVTGVNPVSIHFLVREQLA
jgi:hypothetical protein